MNNTLSTKIRKLSTWGLLLTISTQLITVILMETGFARGEAEEIHELCGFILLGFVLIHALFFRKSLKNLLSIN
jgi:hypothetical protein